MKCEACEKRPAAFLVKHPETKLHWRCVHCVREWALYDSLPFIIFGAVTKRITRDYTNHVAAARMADALCAARKQVPK